MKLNLAVVVLLLSHIAVSQYASPPISQLRRQIRSWVPNDLVKPNDTDPSLLYPAHNFSVPVDHFHNDSKYEPHSDAMFPLRYWFDASYYVPGGPVIVLEAGEGDASIFLTVLQVGIINILAQATNGIGVILEHRYYGTSFPTPDLSIENLRFLTTDQALADTAYFAQNMVFEGLESYNLTSSRVPWIAYGASYAGAFAAFQRVLYPHVFWGAISSSGVTKAIYDYWEYYEAVQEYGPPDCIDTTQKLTNVVDNILIGHPGTPAVLELKRAFDMENVTYNDDFANVLTYGILGWQSRYWGPPYNSPAFSEYCGNITSNSTLYPETSALKCPVKRLLAMAGYAAESATLTTRMLNWIGYVNATQLARCAAKGETQDECFTTHNQTFYKQDDLSQSWRSWPYQYCTQWGFLKAGSTAPAYQLPVISRTMTLPYLSIICRDAFNITAPPDVAAINKYGGYDIAYDRLAIIDGQADPWRFATPHSSAAPPRADTLERPFILMKGAVHAWDAGGLLPNETTRNLPPRPVADTQRAEARFAKAWVEEARGHFC